MPEATMRTSVTIGIPACNAWTPACAAACWKCTRRANSRSPEAWTIRRTTCHSTASKEWGPTSASMMRKLSAMICSGVRETAGDGSITWFARIRHNLIFNKEALIAPSPHERGRGVRGPASRGIKPLTLTLSQRERGYWSCPKRSLAHALTIMTVQERILVRRIDGLALLRHRLAEIFFAQFVPQAQPLPLRFSEDLLLVGEERVGQKHRGHLFAETIPHLQAPAPPTSTAAPALFTERDLGDRTLAPQFL